MKVNRMSTCLFVHLFTTNILHPDFAPPVSGGQYPTTQKILQQNFCGDGTSNVTSAECVYMETDGEK